MTITIKNLQLQFDADTVTEGGPVEQARQMVGQINETITLDESGACILGADDISDYDLEVAEECQNCETRDPYFSSPCGTFCPACMREHVKACEICRAEFDL